MCWCPWVSYSILDKYIDIKCKNNKYYLCIDANFKKILKPQALYNRKFAKSFKVSGENIIKLNKYLIIVEKQNMLLM